MPHLTLDGRRTSYRDEGRGLPVLLLHGFPFSSESFWPQLDAPPPGARLIVPDQRGFGESALAPGISTMEALALDALALLDHLEVPSAVVGGVSMGGYVAIALTRLDPGRVRGLMLFDTQSVADDAGAQARREEVAVSAEAQGMAPIVEAMLPKLLSEHAPPEVRARVKAMMERQNPLAAAAASRGMALRTDGQDILSRYRGRCLVAVGELDVITPPQKARTMAELVSGARLELIGGAGHLANLERPEAFNALLGEFLKGF